MIGVASALDVDIPCLPLISTDIGGSWNTCTPNPLLVKFIKVVSFLFAASLNEWSSNFLTKYSVLFVNPPIGLLTVPVELYLITSFSKNP